MKQPDNKLELLEDYKVTKMPSLVDKLWRYAGIVIAFTIIMCFIVCVIAATIGFVKWAL